MDLLDQLEFVYGGQYTLERTDIQDAKRLTVSHLDQAVSIDLFKSGRPSVGGTNCPLKDEIKKHVEGFRKDPKYFEKLRAVLPSAAAITPEGAILQNIKRELF